MAIRRSRFPALENYRIAELEDDWESDAVDSLAWKAISICRCGHFRASMEVASFLNIYLLSHRNYCKCIPH